MVHENHLVGQWTPVCEAVARLLSPHAEVVLHDPGTNRVLAIWNAFSGRVAGDPSLLSELDGLRVTGRDVYGPYPKSLPDGRQLSSVSAVVRDLSGQAEVVLCINVDRTAFQDAARLLADFAAPTEGQPRALFERDWSETLNDIVGPMCATWAPRSTASRGRTVARCWPAWMPWASSADGIRCR